MAQQATNHNYNKSKEFERSAYDRIYSDDREFASSEIREGFLYESEQRFRQRLIELSPGKRVLEIGCGAGQHAMLSARAGADVLAVDISSAAIELAQRKFADVIERYKLKFQVADVDSLVEQEQGFDLIVNHEVFSSLDCQKILPKLAKLLNKGGRIINLECFAHNPVFNFNRKIGVLRGKRTAWAAGHIFSSRDLSRSREYFSSVDVEYYHLAIFLAYPIKKFFPQYLSSKFENLCRDFDRSIIKNDLFGRFAFKVFVEMKK